MNGLKLFVDDERAHPKTWTLATNHREALSYFRPRSQTHIEQLSLDWYLGTDSLNGLQLAREMIAQNYYFDLDAFAHTQRIILHSSDSRMALRQQSEFLRAQDEGQVNPACEIIINHNCRRHYA